MIEFAPDGPDGGGETPPDAGRGVDFLERRAILRDVVGEWMSSLGERREIPVPVDGSARN